MAVASQKITLLFILFTTLKASKVSIYVVASKQALQHKDNGTMATYEIKFLDRIRGALTAAPTREDPVNQIPHAAPTTDKPRAKATPKLAYPYGDMWDRTSAHP
jgi:hypothetical protein